MIAEVFLRIFDAVKKMCVVRSIILNVLSDMYKKVMVFMVINEAKL